MQKFSEFRPTSYDSHITVENREEWYVIEGIVLHPNLDELFNESNFAVARDMLAGVGQEWEDWDVLHFGHWATPFRIIVVRPDTEAYKVAQEIERKLDNYPLLNEDHYTELQDTEAQRVWRDFCSAKQRIEYIRRFRSQFEFHSFSDMLSCVRGAYFCGYASELLG